MNLPLHLFHGYGVELEYMLVDKDSLSALPITDELLKHELGKYGSDFENGIVTWSNELVLHVVELKSTKPENNFHALENGFADNVGRVNEILTKWNAMLLPTATHPFMNPLVETKLWPHDSNEVYEIYNKIFDCRGHGWSNLQSTHLNLPFHGDEEFAKLHAAIRIVLPILPALCASSPILDGKVTGFADTRLTYYKTNQAKIPSITGQVIPEAIFTKRDYSKAIYEKIKSDISFYNIDGILDPVWVNSRGAIPRFDRGSIEIRVMDIQECPSADLAIVTLVIETLKALVDQKFLRLEDQMKKKTEMLLHVFDKTTKSGQAAMVDTSDYLQCFGLKKTSSAAEIWQHIFDQLIASGNSVLEKWSPELSVILREGNLSERILKALKGDHSAMAIQNVYRQLSGCLAQNKMFIPK